MSFYATAFGAVVDIESHPERITRPSPAVQRRVAQAPSPVELDELTWGTRYNGPDIPSDSAVPPSPSEERPPDNGYQTPYVAKQAPPTGAQTTNGVLASRPPNPQQDSPQQDTTTDVVQRFSYHKWRVLSACFEQLTNGMTASAAGALIPYIERDYQIGYAIVSTIFITQAAGYLLAALFADIILSKVGRAKTLIFSELMVILAYVLLVCNPPFGVVVLAYLFQGIGMAINTALNNVFCANLAQGTVILGAAHGSYGVGGVIGPIIATSFVANGILWTRYWLVTLGLRVLCVFTVAFSWWRHEKEAQINLRLEARQSAKRQLFWQALRNRTTLIGALFIFAYQGAEVSISGWVISFLISFRNGNPAQVGYVSSGFWAGIAVGRFLLSPVCYRIGEKRSVICLTLGATVLQVLVWFIPNVIGPSVAVSFVGLLLGPVYPCAQAVFSRLLPRKIQTSSISFISSAGSSGGAVAPFLTGLLAGVSGTWVLNPICIGLFSAMLASWFFLPKIEKREE
ncbi:MFS general substrate transporter [Rhizodiscina lignyota]|uniref:MFS general substrate transporter n=1 Tax=Rhizodiscina lignyota TaxID=1504668 RepID=A0A9P4I4M8_9PEZI|nr:MFS general substrate transporter [Rhizodiscina lignyota]